MRSTLVSFVGPSFTTEDLGLAWQRNAAYIQLDGLWTLNVAVRGKYLLVSDNAELLTSMLANTNQETSRTTAEFAAGFDHQREKGNFVRLAGLLEKSAGGSGAAGAPDFFSGNIGSLSSALDGLASVKVVIRDAGDKLNETVTYQWVR